LIEVAVAIAILFLVVINFLGTRTDAIIDAQEARDWRVAREIAQEVLSELQAGAREMPPDASRVPLERDDKRFSYQILVSEEQISQHETNAAGSWSSASGDRADRLAWQRERDDIRMARQQGMSLEAYRDQELQEELDLEQQDRVPSEDELEDVMVIVYFPDSRTYEGSTGESSFKLKAKVSTLAVQGLTPEEAGEMARARGEETPDTGQGDAQ
jgi:hypothetical protein